MDFALQRLIREDRDYGQDLGTNTMDLVVRGC